MIYQIRVASFAARLTNAPDEIFVRRVLVSTFCGQKVRKKLATKVANKKAAKNRKSVVTTAVKRCEKN